jgi:hypothetical protein
MGALAARLRRARDHEHAPPLAATYNVLCMSGAESPALFNPP